MKFYEEKMKRFVKINFVRRSYMLRLLKKLIIVGLLIFLWGLFCLNFSNQTMGRFQVLQRFHWPSLISVQQANLSVGEIVSTREAIITDDSSASAINIHKNTSHQNVSIKRPHLRMADGVRIGDFYEYGYLEAQSDLCGTNAGENLRVLILILSKPTNSDKRLAIRQTWGHYASRRDIALAFMLGATNDQSIEDELKAESYMYGDLIRGRFIDGYFNLTLKMISSLEWVDTYCSRVPYMFKTDDDIFINVQRLMSFIEEHRSEEQKKVIFGSVQNGWSPNRCKESKYYLSEQQYPPSELPRFTLGLGYLISGLAIHDLYLSALDHTYANGEDVFITGIGAKLANVERIDAGELLLYYIPSDPCELRKIIAIHSVTNNEQFELWKKLMDTDIKCNIEGEEKQEQEEKEEYEYN